MNLYKHIEIMLIPLILSNVLHMILVKRNVMSWLNIPIWERAFGKNKTWRGVVIIVLWNGFFSILLSLRIRKEELLQWEKTGVFFLNSSFFGDLSSYIGFCILGVLLGFMYLIFELPNSWIKRQLGIGAGELAETPFKRWFFMLLDKSDSAFGVVLFYGCVLKLDSQIQLSLFLISVMVHISLAWLLFKLRIKSSL